MNKRILMWSTLVVVVIAIVVAIALVNRGAVNTAATQAPIVGTAARGKAAPEFQAATNQGFFDLAKTDKPVFLEIFATWCPHCQREASVIDKLYAQYKNRVAFVGVSGSNTGMDGQSPSGEQDVMNFVQTLGVQYPVAYDGSLQVAHEYLQGGFPTLVIIGRDKKVTYLTSGETPYADLNGAIKKALGSS
jgi:thiol-disulfide isomerase/thioredoxin